MRISEQVVEGRKLSGESLAAPGLGLSEAGQGPESGLHPWVQGQGLACSSTRARVFPGRVGAEAGVPGEQPKCFYPTLEEIQPWEHSPSAAVQQELAPPPENDSRPTAIV